MGTSHVCRGEAPGRAPFCGRNPSRGRAVACWPPQGRRPGPAGVGSAVVHRALFGVGTCVGLPRSDGPPLLSVLRPSRLGP